MVLEFLMPESRLLPQYLEPPNVPARRSYRRPTPAASCQFCTQASAAPHAARRFFGGGAHPLASESTPLGISQTRTRPSETSVVPRLSSRHLLLGTRHPLLHPNGILSPTRRLSCSAPSARPSIRPSFLRPIHHFSLRAALSVQIPTHPPLCSLNSLVRLRRNQFCLPSNITPFVPLPSLVFDFDGSGRDATALRCSRLQSICAFFQNISERALHGLDMFHSVYLSPTLELKHMVLKKTPLLDVRCAQYQGRQIDHVSAVSASRTFFVFFFFMRGLERVGFGVLKQIRFAGKYP